MYSTRSRTAGIRLVSSPHLLVPPYCNLLQLPLRFPILTLAWWPSRKLLYHLNQRPGIPSSIILFRSLILSTLLYALIQSSIITSALLCLPFFSWPSWISCTILNTCSCVPLTRWNPACQMFIALSLSIQKYILFTNTGSNHFTTADVRLTGLFNIVTSTSSTHP